MIKSLICLIFFPLSIYSQDIEVQMLDSISDRSDSNFILVDPIETGAHYPGGQDSLAYYIDSNMIRSDKMINGIVQIGFIVEQDGTLSEIQIVKGLNEFCNTESLRLVFEMPKWIPSELQGKKIRSRVVLPIEF